MKHSLLISIFMFAISVTSGVNILVILPNPLFSHFNNFIPIVKALAARDYNITLVSTFPQKVPIPNIKDIFIPITVKSFFDEVNGTDSSKNELWFRSYGFFYVGEKWMDQILRQDVMRELIADTKDNYDLVIFETCFMQEALVAFGHKYNAPIINLSSRFLKPLDAYFSGNHLPPTIVPLEYMSYSDHMTLCQRVENVFWYYWTVFIGVYYYIGKQEELMRKYFKYPGSESLPPLIDMVKNTSLTLAVSTPALHYPVPLHNNVVEFAGLNINDKAQLPPDLQKLMDDAKEGVVYFSIGSHLEFSNFLPENQKAIMKTFETLKQKVLMKVDLANAYINATIPNVLIREWMPQQAILAHPNCKLFITHCGYNSLMEGVYYQVPMIAIPFFVDQHFNAKFVEVLGIGNILPAKGITEDVLSNTIASVMNNKTYQRNIQMRSNILKESLNKSLDNVVYWIEYVIRYKGASHLRPAVLDLMWYQYMMLDVIFVYILILSIAFSIFVICVRCLLKYSIHIYYFVIKKHCCMKIKQS